VMRFPALAATLETIAMRGPRAFYEEAAADIVATLAARGGWLTREDFMAHRGLTATPIATSYRGLEVVELPPNGQGVTALVLLDILENFDLGALDPHGAERLHLMLEAARLAYGVRDTYVADPRYVPIGMPALLDKGYAVRLGERIDRNACMALPPPVLPAGNTVYVTVVDRDRTAVSIINSLYSQFGCGIATEKTGIMLHNRGACFVIDPGHPNTYGPAKRPLSTLIPGLATRNGRCELSFGVMGAAYQAMGHAHVITNLVDYGMDLQAAIDEPRVFFQDDVTIVERGVPPATARGLEARGHRVETSLMPLGGGQAIAIDWQQGVLIGGSDPRKDGCALGY
jgi:gamma-glutamyltranspeptidase/glutathione hydrolase